MGEFKRKKDPNNTNYKAKKYSEKKNFAIENGKFVETENSQDDTIVINKVTTNSINESTTISIDTEVQDERYDATAISNTTMELGVTTNDSSSKIIYNTISDYNSALDDY